MEPVMITDRMTAENGQVLAALGITIGGTSDHLVFIRKYSDSGKAGECVYRHNLITGGVLQNENNDKYGIDFAAAIRRYCLDRFEDTVIDDNHEVTRCKLCGEKVGERLGGSAYNHTPCACLEHEYVY